MDRSASPRASGCSLRSDDGALLPFGEARDGRLLRASEVPAGLVCGCSCPACGAPLVARRGGLRTAHFAHAVAGRGCAAARETVLHRLAKQLIAGGAALSLPEVAAEHGGRRRLVRPVATIRPETATLEHGLAGLRPDILATVAGRSLLVEVAVSHPCGPEKVALIRQRRLAAIEIDLSRVARDASPEALERAVLRSAPRRWLYNRFGEAADAALRAEAANRAARLARAREEALERVGRDLAAAMAAARARHTVGGHLAWAVEVAREAGLDGAIGVAVEGDDCFAVAREVWQSYLVGRHVLGGMPLDERAAAASLGPLLRGRFSEQRPGGFEWAAVSARFPGLWPPSDVLADYARRLGLMGLLARGSDGLWRATKAAATARSRRDALAAQRKRFEDQAARPAP